ncbi:MAG: cobalamin biosynthesis protein CobD [Pseudomonadota bacterium]|jgi:adenosylcobinamide-phosphate synthase
MDLSWPSELMLACASVLGLALTLAVACAVDWRWGEPPAAWHPVVGMGMFLGFFGPRLAALPPQQARLGGALLWLWAAVMVMALALTLDVVATAGVQAVVAAWLPNADGAGLTASAALAVMAMRAAVMGVLLKPLMAWRMLHDEVAAVETALSQSLPEGQAQLARLVSRDVTQLDAVTVRESAIETLAENLNDSVVAPLLWFVLLGLPGAALYRWANTADAMWGYKDHRRWLGEWAARADDVLSWLPARLTVLCLACAAGRMPAWAALRAEAARTPSPNGGWPMGAMALLLGVRLRKPGTYTLNAAGRDARAADLTQALRWCRSAVPLTVALLTAGAGLAWAAQAWMTTGLTT